MRLYIVAHGEKDTVPMLPSATLFMLLGGEEHGETDPDIVLSLLFGSEHTPPATQSHSVTLRGPLSTVQQKMEKE